MMREAVLESCVGESHLRRRGHVDGCVRFACERWCVGGVGGVREGWRRCVELELELRVLALLDAQRVLETVHLLASVAVA